ncbi:ABC transporter ATP-binding protein [Ensifer sp. ENS07]|jgi:peptide/nickel transport system ATP-binding protein|uniref:ABC transporter ATP-binding protein n=1 Tax=Ensifer adhaerens TaxID=106592 RepID=A0A9Q8YE30_ENSAD|nr:MULTISPECIES: ABC transporter ATP-binding protein [Ensifer]OWZ95774.1 ABC transporter ATP-binding protein [Sinorhizobium sp. LM21]ANK75155.1 sugar ABC transporter ATP-binding protein [Ensifer adhaerens]KDP75891.1 sugar ABC transporter ATP-binding protein [Ensifer adhaerens]KQX31649.1 sugar ABC transporter ATP-binding protein [Ensifer sp. Root423]MBD9520205.1 ABC transporter ATP-binding protein [Ensifer sp. ENS02]
MSDALLEIRNLNVDYLLDDGAFRAVNDVSFEVRRGELFGLAGESGCGKSTIAYAITRLSKPPAWVAGGEILLDGQNLLKMPEALLQNVRWRRIGMVFQSAMNSLNPLMRVEAQFFDVLRKHTGATRPQARARAEEMFRLVGIPINRLDDYPHQFSGGMRQRIVIAICLALKPELIIMDEPTTALDVVVQREILEQLVDLQRNLGFSVLFITHDLHLMAQLCHRIGVMLKGQLVEVGDTQQISRAPEHDYTRKLWGAIPQLPSSVRSLGVVE